MILIATTPPTRARRKHTSGPEHAGRSIFLRRIQYIRTSVMLALWRGKRSQEEDEGNNEMLPSNYSTLFFVQMNLVEDMLYPVSNFWYSLI